MIRRLIDAARDLLVPAHIRRRTEIAEVVVSANRERMADFEIARQAAQVLPCSPLQLVDLVGRWRDSTGTRPTPADIADVWLFAIAHNISGTLALLLRLDRGDHARQS